MAMQRGKKGLGCFPTLILWIVAAPILAVLLFAFLPTPPSMLMIQRLTEGHGMHRTWTPIHRISPNLVDAVIAAEDSNFCRHDGFDFEAIEQAMEENRAGRRVRGASTISQQTAKNVFLWPGRDWVRKGFEAGFTVMIETVWTKRRIMEVYLSVAEWGPGIYGAEAAAQHWFGVSAADLTPTQAARLAAILPSPLRYQAAEPGPYVRRRARAVLANMGEVRAQGLSACTA